MESGGSAEPVVGIDVAKAELVVHARPSAEAFSVRNDAVGVEALVGRLTALASAIVVMEASDGYESLAAAAHLAAAGLPIAVVNPRRDCQDFRVRAMGCASEIQATGKRSSNRIAS